MAEHSANYFETSDELAALLSKSALGNEERARMVMKYGKDSIRVELMERIISAIQGAWALIRPEVAWYADLIFEHEDFCVEHDLMKPNKHMSVPKRPEATPEQGAVKHEPVVDTEPDAVDEPTAEAEPDTQSEQEAEAPAKPSMPKPKSKKK